MFASSQSASNSLYSLVFAALVLAAGSLSDRLGRKGALLTGLAIFGVGSAVGALCATPAEPVAVRAVIGLGAAIIFPATLSILTNVFTERAADFTASPVLFSVGAGPLFSAGPISLSSFQLGSPSLPAVPDVGAPTP